MATSIRIFPFLWFLTDFGVIIEEIVFPIINDDSFLRGSSSLVSSTINLGYVSSWSESDSFLVFFQKP